MAADLVYRQVAVIAAADHPCGTCGKGGHGDDPHRLHNNQQSGADGARRQPEPPGRDVTGVTQLNVEVGPKLLELLHEVLPTATIMVLCSSTRPIPTQKPPSETCRQRPARWGCSSMS